MRIRPVGSLDELASVIEFLNAGLGLGEDHRRDLGFYSRVFGESPDLLAVAEDRGRIVGAVLAGGEGDHALVGEVLVSPEYRGRGIGSELLRAVADAARGRGYGRLLLGAVADAEGFYLSNGFRPLLFVQVEGEASAQRLDEFLSGDLPAHEVTWRESGGDTSKAILRLAGLDKGLQRRTERELAGAHTQYLFTKEL